MRDKSRAITSDQKPRAALNTRVEGDAAPVVAFASARRYSIQRTWPRDRAPENAAMPAQCCAAIVVGSKEKTNVVEHQGGFAWYELMTTDMAAAETFYSNVVGWGAQDASAPDLAYTLFSAAGAPISGLMDLPEQAR